MRKGAGIIIAAAWMLQTVPFAASAAEKVTVKVSIRTETDVLERAEVSAGDENGDGSLTVEDVLIAAHEAYYPGGAKEGYICACKDAPELSEIWGIRGHYISFVQDAAGTHKSGELANGDRVFVQMQYGDPASYRFRHGSLDGVRTGEHVNLKLLHRRADNGTDEPVSDAVIVVDGQRTAIRTDENGYAAVSFREPGTHTLSAKLNGSVLLKQSEDVTVVARSEETTAAETSAEQLTATSAYVTEQTVSVVVPESTVAGTATAVLETTVGAAITKLKAGSVKAGESMPLAAFCGAGGIALAAALICGHKKEND